MPPAVGLHKSPRTAALHERQEKNWLLQACTSTVGDSQGDTCKELPSKITMSPSLVTRPKRRSETNGLRVPADDSTTAVVFESWVAALYGYLGRCPRVCSTGSCDGALCVLGTETRQAAEPAEPTSSGNSWDFRQTDKRTPELGSSHCPEPGREPPRRTSTRADRLPVGKAVPWDGALGPRPLDQTWSANPWDGALGQRPIDQVESCLTVEFLPS